MGYIDDLKQLKHDMLNQQQNSRRGSALPPTPARDGFFVRNTTESTLNKYSVVELVEGSIDQSSNNSTHLSYVVQQPLIECRLPTTGAKRLAILLESIPAGKFGKAKIHGILKANVNITSTSHTSATISNGSAVLQSASEGEFNLIQAGGTGEQLAYVSLAGGSGSSGGSGIVLAKVVIGSAENETNELRVDFDAVTADAWLATKTDYIAGNIVSYQDTEEDEEPLAYTAKTGYSYPPTSLDVWESTKADYVEGNKVQYGLETELRGYIAKEGYTYPTNPYEPEDPEYATWEVPTPDEDTDNWELWLDYNPKEDEDNWELKGVDVQCIILGSATGLKYALPYVVTEDLIPVTQIDGIWHCIWPFMVFSYCE